MPLSISFRADGLSSLCTVKELSQRANRPMHTQLVICHFPAIHSFCPISITMCLTDICGPPHTNSTIYYPKRLNTRSNSGWITRQYFTYTLLAIYSLEEEKKFGLAPAPSSIWARVQFMHHVVVLLFGCLTKWGACRTRKSLACSGCQTITWHVPLSGLTQNVLVTHYRWIWYAS